jgi:glycine betaine/proline transport system substrate-binding protein
MTPTAGGTFETTKAGKEAEMAVRGRWRVALLGTTIVAAVAVSFQVIAAAQGTGIESLPLGNKTIKIGADTFSDTETINMPAKVMLERLGYTVEFQTYEMGVLYAGVAEGKIDVYTGGYLPTNHKDFWQKFGARIDKVGPLHEEFRLGLAVPDYVTGINSIADLAGREATFGGRVLGNTPGSGNMRQAAAAIKAYGLKMQLIESSEAAQGAAMAKAIASREPIVFVAWTPQWWWGKWKLRWLDDPKNVVGTADGVWHLARKGLKTDSPRAYAFYQNCKMTAEQQSYLMLQIQEGRKAEDAARKFIEDNPALVKRWLGL